MLGTVPSMTKWFADANLFLRYLTNDVPKQADAVERLLDAAERGDVRLVTNAMVIAELVWVFLSFYKLPKDTIKAYLLGILHTPGLDVADRDLVLQALAWFVEKNVDFIDAYTAAWMQEHDLTTIATFDTSHFKHFEQLTVKVPG